MQFQVPQFETENRILGPFSFVQFMYVGGTILICLVLFPVLQLWIWFILSAFLTGTALTFALAKVNGRPMSSFVLAAFNYFWQPKILVYQQPVTVPVGLKNIRPSATPGKKLEVPVKPQVPEEIISIPTPATPPPEIVVEEKIAVPEVRMEEVVSKPSPIAPTPATPEIKPVPKPSPIPVPVPTPRPATMSYVSEAPAVRPASIPERRPQSLLQGLFNRITVSSAPIPQREQSLKKESSGSKQRYAVIRKASGETEVVRRVDYR